MSKNDFNHIYGVKPKNMNCKHSRIFTKNIRKTLILFGAIFGIVFFSNKILAQIQNIYNPANDQFSGITPLMSAVADGDIDGVKFFSKSGPIAINQKNKGGASALHIACREGFFDITKILIDNGANVNISDNEGWTPLMRASLAGNPAIVEYLIAKGANVNAFNSLRESAIIHATSARCLECLNLIIEKSDITKRMDTIILKSQIADAFIIARNQESTIIQNLLESFLDYVSKITPLASNQLIQNDNLSSFSENNLNTPNKKGYTLKNGDYGYKDFSDEKKYNFEENPNSQKQNLSRAYDLTPTYNLNSIPNNNKLGQTKIPNQKKIYKFVKTLDKSNQVDDKKNYTPIQDKAIQNNFINKDLKTIDTKNQKNISPANINSNNLQSQNNSKVFKFKIGKAPEILIPDNKNLLKNQSPIKTNNEQPNVDANNDKNRDQINKTSSNINQNKTLPKTKDSLDKNLLNHKTKDKTDSVEMKNLTNSDNDLKNNPKTRSPGNQSKINNFKLINKDINKEQEDKSLDTKPQDTKIPNQNLKINNQNTPKDNDKTDIKNNNQNKTNNKTYKFRGDNLNDPQKDISSNKNDEAREQKSNILLPIKNSETDLKTPNDEAIKSFDPTQI